MHGIFGFLPLYSAFFFYAAAAASFSARVVADNGTQQPVAAAKRWKIIQYTAFCSGALSFCAGEWQHAGSKRKKPDGNWAGCDSSLFFGDALSRCSVPIHKLKSERRKSSDAN